MTERNELDTGGAGLDIRLLDGIGPFFRHIQGGRINWSKIPFATLPREEKEFRKVFDRIRQDFATLCAAARIWGFNALTLDDLNHLTDHVWLEPDLREWIGRLRKEFRVLFEIAEDHGLGVYITADVFTASDVVRKKVGGSRDKIHAFLGELVDRFLSDFQQVDGIIFRIGESDGHDVKGALRSELHVRSTRMGRSFLRDLLPVFEHRGKRLVFRTWTVGAYPVGDLLWHKTTLKRLLRGVDSPALVLSMKHGGSDFFRYLEINPNIAAAGVPVIVEFQARREYEGAGEFPAFIGAEHVRVRDAVLKLPNVIGFSVWCQTGGWLPFKRLTFLQPEGVWNEVNTAVTAQLMNHPRMTPEVAVRRWMEISARPEDPDEMVQLLELSEKVICNLWYVREYASQPLFFRRVRIPPLLWIYWDSIYVNHPVKRMLKRLVRDRESALHETVLAVQDLEKMCFLLGGGNQLAEDVTFLSDTGKVLAAARTYFFTKFSKESAQSLKEVKKEYKQRWPRGGARRRFKVKLSFSSFALSRRQLAVIMALSFRKRSRYRVIDRVLMLQLLSWVYRVFKKRRGHMIPEAARKRAMGLDTVFK